MDSPDMETLIYARGTLQSGASVLALLDLVVKKGLVTAEELDERVDFYSTVLKQKLDPELVKHL